MDRRNRRAQEAAELDARRAEQDEEALQSAAQDALTAQAATAGGDTVAQLEKLATLHASGALSDEEFQLAKARLLA